MTNRRSIIIVTLLAAGVLCGLISSSLAVERTLTDEQKKALAGGGDLAAPTKIKRPPTLPDLTKGERIGEKKGNNNWNLGSTGIMGYMVRGVKGDQIQVTSVFPGSPAEGKLQWGDVILSFNGEKFVAGGHLGMTIGKAIIEAEKAENKGIIKLRVWRDRNFAKRNGKRDVKNVDIDKLINKAKADDSVYDWKPEAERAKEIESDNFKEFPLDGFYADVTLKIRVMPAYSDTSPYNCPKTDQILEDAWKVLAKRFVADPEVRRSGRGGILEAIALVASGKPEHRKLVRDWVRGKHSPWRPPTEPIGEMFKPGYRGYKGYQSWHKGFNGLNCALYYDATGDDFVLPALRKYAIETAMGQARGGSWGHTFAYPSSNGGKLHGMNPGYGALNAAGNRCFFLITLAQKLGIKHPEIDLAVKRAHRYFGSYVDKGAIPYGYFGAASTDDSNGKNTGVAFSMKLLGDYYGAKYFAQMSTHASFTRRGGHGHDYHGNWSTWATTICGPEGVSIVARNMRWRRTLCRRHDGSFVYHCPTGGERRGPLRDPTATAVLHYAPHLKQTLITGKNPIKALWTTDAEMKQLMTSAIPQLNDQALIKRAGTPWRQQSTDELLKLLDIFKPKVRRIIAAELGKRYKAGEKDILPRVAKLLESDESRFRGGACRALAACGTDASLKYMSKVARLLKDPQEFVRMQALVTMSKASDSTDTKQAFLNATVIDHENMACGPNNLRTFAQSPLFKGDSKLANSPFDAGFDEKLIQATLERLILLDPMGNRPFIATRIKAWSKDTIVRVAGPLAFIAEDKQINDQMFGGGRHVAARALLGKFGYREYIESCAGPLLKKARIPRDLRPYSSFKLELVVPDVVKEQPAACTELAGPLKSWIADVPLARIAIKVGEVTTYTDAEELLALIKAEKTTKVLPSIADDVEKMFQAKLAAAASNADKLKLCRDELKDPTRKTFFRQMAGMNYLTEKLKGDAIDDLLPYIGHDYWRLRQHSRKLAVKLTQAGAAQHLIERLTKTDAKTAAGILAVLADSDSKTALKPARQALKHESPIVRKAAVKALAALGGDKVTAEVFAFLLQASQTEELHGAEEALLARRTDPKYAQSLGGMTLAALAESKQPARESLYWLLSQLGRPECIKALQTAAAATEDDAEFAQIAYALSMSPDPGASKVMLALVKENKDSPRGKVAARHGVRRMVIGTDDIGNLSNKQRLDYAEPLLNMVTDRATITYIGRIRSGRCAKILQRTMRKGGATDVAAQSIIKATDNLEKAPPADLKLAISALIDTIEYIEVTQLRGGGMTSVERSKSYIIWKALSARAGKNLLKINKLTKKEPLPDFGDPDLDLDP
jgi:HEAT repeat protein